jgi:putative membrane protein
MKHIIHIVIQLIAIAVASYLLPGVIVDSISTLFILSVVLIVFNVVLKPILKVITLPINIITLGLFSFVVNALLVLLASNIVAGFSVDSFGSAILFSLIVSLVNFVGEKLED